MGSDRSTQEVDTARDSKLLDIHRAWPLTLSRLSMWSSLGMAICAVVLTLPVQPDWVRLVLGSLGTFIPLLIGIIQAIGEVSPGGGGAAGRGSTG